MPPQPLQVQLYEAFLGQEEGIHSVLLPDVYSSGGSINLWMDKIGRARKLEGYAKQNSSAVTTDGGGDAAALTGLFAYRSTSGGSITRLLIGVFDDGRNEWELHKSSDDGQTWSLIADLGAEPVGQYPDFAQYDDDLFITNGKLAPRTFDGTTLTTSGATQSPQPTAAGSGTTGLLNGTYYYKLVSVEGDGTRAAGSLQSDPVGVSDKTINLTWTADANTEVVGYDVYRTTGTGSTFLWVSYVDGRTTTTFTDNVPDKTILAKRALDNHGDAPPTAWFVEPHKGRMWWGRTDEHPVRVWWSDPGDPDSVYALHYLDFADSETQGDQVVGLIGNFGEQLVVFTEKAIWTVSGTGLLLELGVTDWNKDRRNTATGAVSGRSVVRVPAGSKYINSAGETVTTLRRSLAYMTPLGDIRLFDGDRDEIISFPVKDVLDQLYYSSRSKVHAVHDPEHGHFVWFFPAQGSESCNKAIAWNYVWGVWYEWSPLPFASSVLSESDADAAFVLTGAATPQQGGYCYQFFTGDSFDGAAFESRWMTKILRGVVNIKDDLDPAVAWMKRWRWVDVVSEIFHPDVAITVEWYNADADDDDNPIASTSFGPNVRAILSADLEPIVSASSEPLVSVVPLTQKKVLLKDGADYIYDTGIRLRFGDNAMAGSWTIEAFSLAYQRLEGLRRRSQ